MAGLAAGWTTPVQADEPQAAGASAPTLDITVTGFRNDRGLLRVVLCPAGSDFPECGAQGKSQSVAIVQQQARVRFAGLAPGRYAVAVFHDAKVTGRLQTFLGIPVSGFGFSNNPPVRPRAPRFAECAIDVRGDTATTIRLRYLL